MTFPAKLERLLKEATKAPWLCIDLRPEEEKLTVTDGVTVICRTKNSVRMGPISPEDVANSGLICLLRNHADAILGLVRDMERIAEWGCDEAEKYDGTCAGDIVRLAQYSIAKLNGGKV